MYKLRTNSHHKYVVNDATMIVTPLYKVYKLQTSWMLKKRPKCDYIQSANDQSILLHCKHWLQTMADVLYSMLIINLIHHKHSNLVTIDEERRNSLLWGQHGWGACNANRVRGKKIFRLRKPSTTDDTTPGKYITYSPNLGPGLEWALGTAF